VLPPRFSGGAPANSTRNCRNAARHCELVWPCDHSAGSYPRRALNLRGRARKKEGRAMCGSHRYPASEATLRRPWRGFRSGHGFRRRFRRQFHRRITAIISGSERRDHEMDHNRHKPEHWNWFASCLDGILLRYCSARCDIRTIQSRPGHKDASSAMPVHKCCATERLQGKSSDPNGLLTNREATDEHKLHR
jgi:hypothetical protein